MFEQGDLTSAGDPSAVRSQCSDELRDLPEGDRITLEMGQMRDPGELDQPRTGASNVALLAVQQSLPSSTVALPRKKVATT